ncbi:MAG TPA: excinuclease ABC subunit UvrC [Dehalococcoidia bacterium]|nr:excinuclease ABC subunit UvrC [Dehalococcoidia bacterium]
MPSTADSKPAARKRRFSSRLSAVPSSPGVYLMRAESSEILYVGKASILRNRLRSYFGTNSSHDVKTRKLVTRIDDFEYIVTESEQEALLLENSLIKQHKPRYNIRLKDDKTYPYIKIDVNEPFPQVYVTRRTAKDGARYFGPFASAGSVRKTLGLIKRLFPYRSCTKPITGTDDRPCLDFHIKRCVGPCIGAVDREEYMHVINQVVMFLEGDTRSIVKGLGDEMMVASDALEFERAGALRDQLKAIERVYEGQKVLSMTAENMDVIAIASDRDEAWVEVFFVRRGNLIGRDHFIMSGTRDENASGILTQFIKQFYGSASHVPRRVLIPEEVEDTEIIESWLSERRDGPVNLSVPKRGEKRRLLEMVAENAAEGLEQLKLKWLSDSDVMGAAMQQLQEELSLPRLPQRMECYDISHIQGTNTVASMVVFEDGKPKTSDYRSFKIKTHDKNDDFASMREVLHRRFSRLKKAVDARAAGEDAKDDAFGIVPDLVLIDGGKGQLSSVLQVMLELGIEGVPLASLAKQEEEIFIPDSPEPYILTRGSQGLFLVQRIRDEAHRFAITFHRNLRSKSARQSALDLVPGIGPKRKRQLVRQFGSLKGIREASIDDLAASPGMTRKLAERVKENM